MPEARLEVKPPSFTLAFAFARNASTQTRVSTLTAAGDASSASVALAAALGLSAFFFASLPEGASSVAASPRAAPHASALANLSRTTGSPAAMAPFAAASTCKNRK